mmetsp:Transcript_17541/g.29594  ORF Transcript_17541/g.29594 Transcript_17541/m.29594 type:complete len:121 (-) Transcript_17541:544-906(-)
MPPLQIKMVIERRGMKGLLMYLVDTQSGFCTLKSSSNAPSDDLESTTSRYAQFAKSLLLQRDVQLKLSDYARKLHILSGKKLDGQSLKQSMAALNLLEAAEDNIYAHRQFGGPRIFKIET